MSAADESDHAHSPPAADAAAVRTIVVDVAEAGGSHDVQDALTDFVWHALERGYQIVLASSTSPKALADEDFTHPQLKFLTEPLPPGPEVLAAHPELAAPGTLWVTDHAPLQLWVRERGLPFAFLAQQVSALAPGLPVGTFSALATLLDPSLQTLQHVAAQIERARIDKTHGPLLVGIGGPPGSSIAQVAVQLKRTLESGPAPVVELLDLSSFLASTDVPPPAGAEPWLDAAAGRWLIEHVLGPAAAGQRIYLEQRPDAAPRDFDAHFPFFVAEEAIVLVLGEMLFVEPIRSLLDLSILVEVSPTETTRRVYEIEVGEPFDPQFTKLYMSREGHRYWEYLRNNHVLEQADVRINGDRPTALRLVQESPALN